MAISDLQELIQLNNVDIQKQVEQAVVMQSVVDLPDVRERMRPAGPLVFNIALQADEFTPWGYDLKRRDEQLRGFWHTEPLLASAVYMMTARMAAMKVQVVGRNPKAERPRNSIMLAERLLRSADRGAGWQNFIVKLLTDVYTQDNGGFIEIVRRENRPDSPVLGIAHLDSFRCERTGDPEVPVIYRDRKGREHKLSWWHVQTVEDMPAPVETMYGAQYSAITRALRAAQIIRDIAVYKKEKISGAFARAVHFISGVTRQNIDDGLALAQEAALNQNLARFNPAPIIPTLDPESNLKHVQVDLAALPDGFDEEVTLQWYVTQLAIAFGVDYQEFAPLASGALGSGQQSEVLDKKSRGKGPALLIAQLEHTFNDNGILPSNVLLQIATEDSSADEGRANARFTRGKDRSLRVESGEIDGEAARQLAVIDGDLPVEVYEEMQTRPEPKPLGAGDPLTSQQVSGGMQTQNRKGWDDEGMPIKQRLLIPEINIVPREPEIIVNLPAPIINVDVPEQQPPVVNVSVPKQAAPNVTVNVPEPNVKVDVNVPQQKAPVVNVQAPEVTVNVPEQKAPIVQVVPTEEVISVERDPQTGRIRSLKKSKAK